MYGTPAPSSADSIVFRCMAITAPESVDISPDGRFVAAFSGAFSTVSVWNLEGALESRYVGQSAVTMRWSPDSSHLLIWDAGRHAVAQGVNASSATLPLHSGALDMYASASGQQVAVETSESGTPVLYDWSLATDHPSLIARGVHLLGWSFDGIVYARGLQVFVQTPGITAATQLGASQQAIAPAEFDSPTSPDGQALIVRYGENGSAVITKLGIRPIPPSAGPPLWVAPHSLIEYDESAGMSLYDVVAGASGGAVGEASGVPQAISGRWVAWQSNGDIGLTMLGAATTPSVSTAPVAGTISSLGGGAFLLHGGGLSFEFGSQDVALPPAPGCAPA